MHVHTNFLTSALLGSLLLPSANFLAAATPVQYDVSYAVACYEIVDHAVLPIESAEKLIEVKFRVSVKTHSAASEDLKELYFEFANPPRRMRVVDFSPREQFESQFVGEIEVTKTNEHLFNGSLNIGAKVPVPYGELLASTAPGANVGTTTKNSVKEIAKRIAPRDATLLAGTTTNGHGVFFKLKQSDHVPWDGLREFTVLFAVPDAWQADWLLFSAHAVVQERSLFGAEVRRVAPARILLALYLAGDSRAYSAAQQFSGAQTNLFHHLQAVHQQAAWGKLVEEFVQKANSKLVPFRRTAAEEAQSTQPDDPSELFFLARSQLDRLAG